MDRLTYISTYISTYENRYFKTNRHPWMDEYIQYIQYKNEYKYLISLEPESPREYFCCESDTEIDDMEKAIQSHH